MGDSSSVEEETVATNTVQCTILGPEIGASNKCYWDKTKLFTNLICHCFKYILLCHVKHSISTLLYAPNKEIGSRDWGGLQMILLDRLEVFNITASSFFLCVCVFI